MMLEVQSLPYVDRLGVQWDINRNPDGTYSVWSWENKQTGWIWRGTLPTFGSANKWVSVMGDFEEEA